MKHLFYFIAIVLLMTNCEIKKSVPIVNVTGDLTKYVYVYVIPTKAITSGQYGGIYGVSLGETSTVNPSDLISGYLMKKGYTSIPSIIPELIDKTLIVAYGSTGISSNLIAKSGVIIQIRDAKTNELIASCEAEGTSTEKETDALSKAILNAMNSIFAKNQQ